MNKLKFAFYGVMMILVVGIMLVSFSRPFNKVSNRREITATVTDKEVKNKSDDSKYLVYTIDENGSIQVFEITDALFAWQFDSSDIYAGIESERPMCLMWEVREISFYLGIRTFTDIKRLIDTLK